MIATAVHSGSGLASTACLPKDSLHATAGSHGAAGLTDDESRAASPCRRSRRSHRLCGVAARRVRRRCARRLYIGAAGHETPSPCPGARAARRTRVEVRGGQLALLGRSPLSCMPLSPSSTSSAAVEVSKSPPHMAPRLAWWHRSERAVSRDAWCRALSGTAVRGCSTRPARFAVSHCAARCTHLELSPLLLAYRPPTRERSCNEHARGQCLAATAPGGVRVSGAAASWHQRVGTE